MDKPTARIKPNQTKQNDMFEVNVNVNGEVVGGKIIGDVFRIDRIGKRAMPPIMRNLTVGDIDLIIKELTLVKEKIQ
ncbi:hypothetical protein [Peribacillus asahii]|uniref:hypothetical protein n=1 Tax=Peribacillus asahii TaxID=228899 RepID=UPI0037FCDBE6